MDYKIEATPKRKDYWITNSRFKYVGMLLIVMWLFFMLFLYLKADEITKDPCTICAEYMGDKVTCFTGTTYPIERTYYPNGSINDNFDEMQERARQDGVSKWKLNLSELEDSIIE